MNILGEFKAFALKGNMVDMAVGLMLGAAFNSVVNSLVNDIFMPPIGMWIQKEAFTDWFISLSGGTYQSLAEAQASGAATINVGVFVNNAISFLITALVLFFIVRYANRRIEDQDQAKDKSETKDCPFCYTSIARQATRCPNCTSQLESR